MVIYEKVFVHLSASCLKHVYVKINNFLISEHRSDIFSKTFASNALWFFTDKYNPLYHEDILM